MAENENTERSRADTFFSRTGWWYFAAAIVLVVVAGLVWVLLPSGHDPVPGQAPAVSTGPAPWNPDSNSDSADTGWNDRGCSGSAGTSAVPTTAPHVSWIAIGLVSSPTSPDYGPRRTDGPVRSCFQHSPTGALVAAASIIESAAADSTTAAQVLTAGMTPGPGLDSTISSITASAKPSKVVPAGFSFGACQPDRCQLRLLVVDGAYGQVGLSMAWQDGDWKIDGSGDLTPVATMTMPSGYIPWGPAT